MDRGSSPNLCEPNVEFSDCCEFEQERLPHGLVPEVDRGGATMKRPGVGNIVLLAALIGLLILTAVWAVWAWNAGAGAVMGKHGWIALCLGTFFSLVIGWGLMALMFFPSRSGYDELADPFRYDQFADPLQHD